jgi:hypothetical protein
VTPRGTGSGQPSRCPIRAIPTWDNNAMKVRVLALSARHSNSGR